MKRYYHTDSKKWIVIGDLHLNSFHGAGFEMELVNELIDAPKDYGIIVLGDFINPHYKRQDLWFHHPQLMKQLSKRTTVYVKGNNDPDISPYDGVILYTKNHTWTLEHGHSTPDWFNKAINHFKFESKHRNGLDACFPTDKQERRLRRHIELHHRHRYITGHFHTAYHSKDGRISILPWKAYYLDELIKDK